MFWERPEVIEVHRVNMTESGHVMVSDDNRN